MCLRLSDHRRCLSLLTFLGILQSVVAVPIIVLSFIQFFSSTLGVALSPFWCGFLVSEISFGLAACIRDFNCKIMLLLADVGSLVAS